MTKNKIIKNITITKKDLVEFFYLTLSVFALALAVNVSFSPYQLDTGGTAGVAIVVSHLTSMTIPTLTFIINLALVVLAFFTLGNKFTFKTLISSVILLPIFLNIIPVFKIADNDLVLAALVGGVLQGISTGLLAYADGSTGGTTVLGRILAKKLHMNFAVAVAFLDGTIVVLGSFVFGIQSTLYALIVIVVAMLVGNKIINGMTNSSMFYIITSCEEELTKEIMAKMHRGVTLIEAVGGYSKESKKIVTCIVSKKQIVKLKNLIYEIDPEAFVSNFQASSVHGNGFSHYNH